MYPASERIQIENCYGDIPQGILMIRGENVALLGEVGKNKNKKRQKQKQVPANQLLSDQVARDNNRKKVDKLREMACWKRGLLYSSDDFF